MRSPHERRGAAAAKALNLTPRQTQVMELIASGMADKEIAARLKLSHSTVRTHIQRIYESHGLRNRAEAAAAWMAASGAVAPPRAPPRRLTNRFRAGALALAAIVVAAAVLSLLLVRLGSSPSSPASARDLLPIVNGDRSGLPQLTWDQCLAEGAARSATDLAALGYVGAPVAQPAALCGGLALEVRAYWSDRDSAAANRILAADPRILAAIRGSHRKIGAAWATDSAGTAFLVVMLS